jgi:hypothetical protein
VIIATGVAFGGTLLLVRDFDQPDSGLTGRDPDQAVLRRIPGFRPATMPVT